MLVFAHRGIHDRHTTENTLLAFKRAVHEGVDGIEFDLRLSRDGEPVVIHDANLRRVAGDARGVRDLTATELGRVVLRGHGSIPSLNEVTAVIPPPLKLDIEIKVPQALKPLIAKLKTSAGLRRRVIVSSFHLDVLKNFSREMPGVPTLSLNRRWPLPLRRTATWRRLAEAGIWGVGFPINILTAERLRTLRRQGWRVASWDLRQSDSAARALAALAPDIVITYRPELVVS